MMVAKGNKVVARWRNKASLLCLLFWHTLCVEEARKRNVMGRIILRMSRKGLAAALDAWCATVQDLSQQRAVHQCKMRTMEKIVKRMMNAAVSHALSRWCANVKELKMMVAKGNKVVARWRNKSSLVCLLAWHILTVDELRKRDAMTGIFVKWTHRVVSRAFSTWSINAPHQAHLVKTVAAILTKWTNKSLTQALSKWIHTTRIAKHQLDVLCRAVGRLHRRDMSMAFEIWCQFVAVSRATLLAMQRMQHLDEHELARREQEADRKHVTLGGRSPSSPPMTQCASRVLARVHCTRVKT